ncbi:hypothetical protein M9458_043906, partial [Cirrhinus mrigala]
PQDFSWVPLSSWFFFNCHMGRNSQSPSSQNIFGVHHSSDPEERDRDSKPPLLQTIETFTRDCIRTLVHRPRQ